MLFTTITALTIGFLAGLWAFKVKSRWCPRCGSSTTDAPHPPEAG